jgi:hypothetical protein
VHPYRDGRSSDWVMDAVEHPLEEGMLRLRPKPINLVRKAKIRQRMKYYRWR